MTYIVDPTNPNSPAATDPAGSAYLEFQALKSYLQTNLTSIESEISLLQAGLPSSPGAFSSGRNKIINGAMDVNQWHSVYGNSVTPASSQYVIDRWFLGITQASKLTVQQVTDAPVGFYNSLQVLVASAYTPIPADAFYILQKIENFNWYDMMFGSSSAQEIAISFWVKSSITGVYPVALVDNTGARAYVSSINITTANAWQFCNLLIPGDTFNTTVWNVNGASLIIDLASGTNYQVTPNVWQADAGTGIAGQVQFTANAGALFKITGVQVEAAINNTYTPFERKLYTDKLAACMRYMQLFYGVVRGQASGSGQIIESPIYWKVPMRANPSCALITAGARSAGATVSVIGITNYNARFSVQSSASGDTYAVDDFWYASAEM